MTNSLRELRLKHDLSCSTCPASTCTDLLYPCAINPWSAPTKCNDLPPRALACKRREANTNGDTGDVEALPRNHKAMALNQAIAQLRHAPKLCSQLFSHAATTMNGWWWWEWSGCSSSSEVRDKKHKTGRGGHWSKRMTHEVRIARSLRSVELAVPRRPMTCTRRWTKYSQICLIPNTNQTSG